MVDENVVYLCKVASFVRDSYELRLCLFLAQRHGKSFTLVMPPGGRVAPELVVQIKQQGGAVVEAPARDYSVYFGAVNAAGVEHDGWVLGNSDAYAELGRLIQSSALRAWLTPGMEIRGAEVAKLCAVLRAEQFTMKNVDGEDVRQALLDLCVYAESESGAVFAQ